MRVLSSIVFVRLNSKIIVCTPNKHHPLYASIRTTHTRIYVYNHLKWHLQTYALGVLIVRVNWNLLSLSCERSELYYETTDKIREIPKNHLSSRDDCGGKSQCLRGVYVYKAAVCFLNVYKKNFIIWTYKNIFYKIYCCINYDVSTLYVIIPQEILDYHLK